MRVTSPIVTMRNSSRSGMQRNDWCRGSSSYEGLKRAAMRFCFPIYGFVLSILALTLLVVFAVWRTRPAGAEIHSLSSDSVGLIIWFITALAGYSVAFSITSQFEAGLILDRRTMYFWAFVWTGLMSTK